MSESLNKTNLICKGVTKYYSDTRAVEDIDLNVDSSEQLAIIGPSGAGKTTLLHLLGGLENPDKGSVLINDNPLSSYNPGKERSRLVGVMHQQFDLVDQLSVINNVLAGRLGEWSFFRSLYSLFFPLEKSKAINALSRAGIENKAFEKTHHLSGGEQQRVALARLLIQHPQIILADEPIASVDPARAEELLTVLKKIASEEDLSLIVSLHSVDLALEYFPRIVAMRSGRVLYDRPSEDINNEELNHLYQINENQPREKTSL